MRSVNREPKGRPNLKAGSVHFEIRNVSGENPSEGIGDPISFGREVCGPSDLEWALFPLCTAPSSTLIEVFELPLGSVRSF